MTHAEILQHLTREDLPPDLQDIWDSAGPDVVRLLLEHAAGLRIYIPTHKSMPTLIDRLVHRLAITQSAQSISRALCISQWKVKQHLAGKGKIIRSAVYSTSTD